MAKQQEQDVDDEPAEDPVGEARAMWEQAAERLAVAREGMKKAKAAEKAAQLEADAAYQELQMLKVLEKHVGR